MFDLTCGDTCSLSEAERERAPSLDEIQVCSRPASTTRTLSPGGTTQEEAQPSNYKHLQRSRPFPELGTQIQRELGPPVAWGTAHLPSGRRRRSGWNAPAQRIFQVTLPSLLPCPSLPPQYAAGLGQSPWSVLPPLPPIAPPATRAGAGTTRPPSGCEAQAGRAQVHWWASHSLCSQSAWQDTPLPPRFPECHLSQPFQEPACDWQQTTAHSSSRGNTGQDRTLAGAAWPCPGPFVSCTGYPRDGCWWPRRRPPRPQARVSPSQTLEGAGTRGAGCRVPSGREGHTSEDPETSWRPSPRFLVEYPDFKCWQASFFSEDAVVQTK